MTTSYKNPVSELLEYHQEILSRCGTLPQFTNRVDFNQDHAPFVATVRVVIQKNGKTASLEEVTGDPKGTKQDAKADASAKAIQRVKDAKAAAGLPDLETNRNYLNTQHAAATRAGERTMVCCTNRGDRKLGLPCEVILMYSYRDKRTTEVRHCEEKASGVSFEDAENTAILKAIARISGHSTVVEHDAKLEADVLNIARFIVERYVRTAGEDGDVVVDAVTPDYKAPGV